MFSVSIILTLASESHTEASQTESDTCRPEMATNDVEQSRESQAQIWSTSTQTGWLNKKHIVIATNT